MNSISLPTLPVFCALQYLVEPTTAMGCSPNVRIRTPTLSNNVSGMRRDKFMRPSHAESTTTIIYRRLMKQNGLFPRTTTMTSSNISSTTLELKGNTSFRPKSKRFIDLTERKNQILNAHAVRNVSGDCPDGLQFPKQWLSKSHLASMKNPSTNWRLDAQILKEWNHAGRYPRECYCIPNEMYRRFTWHCLYLHKDPLEQNLRHVSWLVRSWVLATLRIVGLTVSVHPCLQLGVALT